MKVRIAIIGSRGYPSTYGGFETFVRRIAPFLADRGHGVTVYGRSGDAWRRPTEGSVDGIRTVVTRGIDSKSFSTLRFGCTAAWHARSGGYDAALVMNVANGYFLRVLRRADVPVVVNVDGIEWERAKWNRLAKAVFYRGASASARNANILVADSRAIADYWRSEFGVEARFIPYGGESSEPDDDAAFRTLGLTERRYVLVVARLVPENNVDLFLDACDLLAPDTEVVVVGSAVGGSSTEDRLRILDKSRYRWLGHVHDQALLRSLWRHAGVYFHGHSVGGTNPALLQAMGSGAPVVAVNTVFNREVITPGSGVLVEADARAIAESLRSVLADDVFAAALGQGAMKRVADAYTWDGVCAAYLEALEAAVAGK